MHKRHLLVASVLLMALTGCGVGSEAVDVEEQSGQSAQAVLNSTDPLLGEWRSSNGAYVHVVKTDGTSTLKAGADGCWYAGIQVYRYLTFEREDGCGCKYYKGERNMLGACLGAGTVRWGPTTLKLEGNTLTETFVDPNDGVTKNIYWVR